MLSRLEKLLVIGGKFVQTESEQYVENGNESFRKILIVGGKLIEFYVHGNQHREKWKRIFPQNNVDFPRFSHWLFFKEYWELVTAGGDRQEGINSPGPGS